MARDITEGRGDSSGYGRAIAADIGIVSSTTTWQNTDVAYDVAIGGMPFIYAINDQRPYLRQTAPFRKDQFDNGAEPGEQSLTGWWIRSQSSFHSGTGINFFDPNTTDEVGHYRFNDSKGVDVWTKGEVTLLKNVTQTHNITGTIASNRRPWQLSRGIHWNGIASINNKALTTNVATLTAASAHYFSAGDTVTIYGVDTTFDGIYVIQSTPSTTTFTYNLTATNVPSTAVSPTGTAIISTSLDAVLMQDKYDVDKIYPTITAYVSNKALTSNVATLTTNASHGFKIGMDVEITGVDATFNGEYTITTVPSPTTFTYAKTATNVASTAVSPVGTVTSNVTHFINYNAGVGIYPVHAICDDGTHAYWVTNVTAGGVTKMTVFKKPLTGTALNTADEVTLFQVTGTIVDNAVMEYVKDRIVACFDNKIYEFSSTASALPTPLYTNTANDYVYTSIAASGSAIYVAGFNGIQSSIQKFTIAANGTMPTLSSAVVAAEFPSGELVYRIYYYLGYLMIGTNKGIRVATISEIDGSISYGPLIVETTQPCYDFAARDRFVWCATGVDGEPGLIRIDLGNSIETLRFAYANDIYYPGVSNHSTTSCSFLGTTNRIFFTTAAGSVGYGYIEDADTLITNGYLTTGRIRYGTLEPKNFKRLRGRGDFTYGSMTLETVDKNNTEYDHISYDSVVGTPEITTLQPASAQEYVSYKFILYRDATTSSRGPVFKGYQAKATIATPRQRVIQFPVYCFDVETDRFNSVIGYEGRAFDRIQLLEDIEEGGDVINWQDLNTGETRQAVIERVTFTRGTPPDRGFSGFGGVLELMIRTV